MNNSRAFSHTVTRRLVSSASLAAVLAFLALPTRGQTQAPLPALETIFTGQFFTLDPAKPQVQAIGVAAGKLGRARSE